MESVEGISRIPLETGSMVVTKPQQSSVSGLEKPTGFSSFESELFRNGVLQFNLDDFTRRAQQRLDEKQSWCDSNPFLDEKQTVSRVDRERQYQYSSLLWFNSFKGRVPAAWDNWIPVRHAFEQANKRGAVLSPDLVDAGISHPHHLVANEAGKTHKLNVKQIAWILIRPDIPFWNRDKILEAQREMGVSKGDIKKATKIAKIVREAMQKDNAPQRDKSGLKTLKMQTDELVGNEAGKIVVFGGKDLERLSGLLSRAKRLLDEEDIEKKPEKTGFLFGLIKLILKMLAEATTTITKGLMEQVEIS